MDLFCGTGGFSHGVARGLGKAEVVLGIDYLEIATRTFAANNPDAVALHGDIREWTPGRVAKEHSIGPGDVDVIVGGPPCQGFSSIRPNRATNQDDARNGLYESFVSYVEFYSPAVFVMENVVGLATHEQGKLIDRIQTRFRAAGYAVDWKIVNAASFGVPQRRERLIMVGSRDSEVAFPLPSHRATGDTIGHHDKTRMLSEVDITQWEARPLAKAVTTLEAISDLPPIEAGSGANAYESPPRNNYQRLMRVGAKTLTLHQATGHTAKMLNIIRHSGFNINALPDGLVTSGFSTCYSRLEPDLPAATITVNFVHPASNKCIHPFQDRALTPREGARLQSFEDSFAFAGTRTQIVKQIGNAVPPVLGEAIGRTLNAMINGRPAPLVTNG